MGARLGLTFITFFLLVFVNFFISTKMLHQEKQMASASEILSEIDNASSDQGTSTSAPFVLGAFSANIEPTDARAANLKSFFRKYNSPLYDEADYIVQVSDKYKFDYRLLPAIAMQESNLCRYIPEGSHNCWGWGIYEGSLLKFDSYNDAIDAVAQGLKEEYIDHGLVTASAIMKKYTPGSNGSWAHGVNEFLLYLQ